MSPTCCRPSSSRPRAVPARGSADGDRARRGRDGHAGVARGVNNAVARAASLLAVAVLPVLAGISRRRLPAPGVLPGRLPDRDGALRGTAVGRRVDLRPDDPQPGNACRHPRRRALPLVFGRGAAPPVGRPAALSLAATGSRSARSRGRSRRGRTSWLAPTGPPAGRSRHTPSPSRPSRACRRRLPRTPSRRSGLRRARRSRTAGRRCPRWL